MLALKQNNVCSKISAFQHLSRNQMERAKNKKKSGRSLSTTIPLLLPHKSVDFNGLFLVRQVSKNCLCTQERSKNFHEKCELGPTNESLPF